MKTVLLLCLALLICSCQKATPPTTAEETPAPSTQQLAAGEAPISATPNPIKGGPTEGTTTISWDTKGEGEGDVYVSQNGAPEKLFASGNTGSKAVSWIRQGSKYQFTLYQHSSHKSLGQVQVTHHP
jgi:hypothetical protein